MTQESIERQAWSELLECQRRVLERVANRASLAEIFETLVKLIEDQTPDMRCAVLLVDSDGHNLHFVAAPNIPEDYKRNIEAFLRIAPSMASCGTAAFRREPVYTRDTKNDPLWKDAGHIAVRNGLRAIWSTPILSDDNAVLGTFAMYYTKPRLPSAQHIQLIDMAVQMARVAIEAKRTEDALRKSEDRLRLVINTIPTMAWSVLPDGTVDFLNQRWLDYAGVSLHQYLEAPTSVIHPGDAPRVLEKWRAAMPAGEPYEDEMRLRRADGQYRWFLIRTVPLRDEQGNIVKWYGTSTDIEERKQAEDTLRRNQAFFAAEAHRIDGLLNTAAPGDGNEGSAGDELAAATWRGVAGKSPPGEVVAERSILQNQRLIAERQAIESLTANERSIIRLITAGKSNVEVAALMHLSPRTVETYRSRLMEKLQLEDLVALVKFAIRNGMSSID
ncbi:MAG TPA: PAS domain-containing protein [Burkholderiaceae bacterium]|nr:PAS domain-containing protein [Burkholderiaceae bacterium]